MAPNCAERDHSVKSKLWGELAGSSASPWEGMPRHAGLRLCRQHTILAIGDGELSSRAGVLQIGTIFETERLFSLSG